MNHMPQQSQNEALSLSEGEKLYLMADLQNNYNLNAMALRTASREIIGYLPNYMANEAYRLLETCDRDSIEFTISQVNADAPMNFALLCKLDACWNEGSLPFSDIAFEPISKLAPISCNAKAAA